MSERFHPPTEIRAKSAPEWMKKAAILLLAMGAPEARADEGNGGVAEFAKAYREVFEQFSGDNVAAAIETITGIPDDGIQESLSRLKFSVYSRDQLALVNIQPNKVFSLGGNLQFAAATKQGDPLVMLNMDAIMEAADAEHVTDQAKIAYAISLGVMDSFRHERMNGSRAPKQEILYAGLREYFAVRLASEIEGREMPSLGFDAEAGSIAAFVLGTVGGRVDPEHDGPLTHSFMTGEMVAAQAFFDDNPDMLTAAFDSNYGNGAWDAAKEFSLDLELRTTGLDYLYGLLKVTENDNQALNLANDRLYPNAEIVPLLESFDSRGSMNGVVIRKIGRNPSEFVPRPPAVVGIAQWTSDNSRAANEINGEILNGEILGGFILQKAMRNHSLFERYVVLLGQGLPEEISFDRTKLDELVAMWTPTVEDRRHLNDVVKAAIRGHLNDPYVGDHFLKKMDPKNQIVPDSQKDPLDL